MTQPKRVTDALSVTTQPNEDDIRRFAELGYRTLINNRPDGEEPGQLPADEAETIAEHAGMQYVHLPVKVGAIGAGDVEAFHRALREHPGPIVAHCKSGTRSYLLWAAGEVLRGERTAEQVVRDAGAAGYDLSSLPGLVERLKTER